GEHRSVMGPQDRGPTIPTEISAEGLKVFPTPADTPLHGARDDEDGAGCPSSPPSPPHRGPDVIVRLMAPVSLFALSYLAAAAALRAGWVTLFVVSLLVSQTAAVGLFLLRPTGL